MSKTYDMRWCPAGQHSVPKVHFRILTKGGLARDCHNCEARKQRALEAKIDAILTAPKAEPQPARRQPRSDGVDIDRIHLIRGAAKPHMLEQLKKRKVA